MKIEIRTRELKDGNPTIYLDFYDKGHRWYEYLNLHLSPQDRPPNQSAKRECNKEGC